MLLLLNVSWRIYLLGTRSGSVLCNAWRERGGGFLVIHNSYSHTQKHTLLLVVFVWSDRSSQWNLKLGAALKGCENTWLDSVSQNDSVLITASFLSSLALLSGSHRRMLNFNSSSQGYDQYHDKRLKNPSSQKCVFIFTSPKMSDLDYNDLCLSLERCFHIPLLKREMSVHCARTHIIVCFTTTTAGWATASYKLTR